MWKNNNRLFYCPRCHNNKIVDYGDTFDCPLCCLEFEKIDFALYKDSSNILSIEEKVNIIKFLKE